MKECIYRLMGVWKNYPDTERKELQVLRGISMEIPRGVIAILGPSGEGKSTLLNLLGMLDAPSSGEICFDGQAIPCGHPDRLRLLRSMVGPIFQDHNLISHFSALDNVALPLENKGYSKRAAREHAADCLKRLGLGGHLHKKPRTLSGGQRQRVGIARAIASEAKVILADEPTGNLDHESATTVMQMFVRLYEQTGIPIIIVTHNHEMAERFCSARYELRDGGLHQYGDIRTPAKPTLTKSAVISPYQH